MLTFLFESFTNRDFVHPFVVEVGGVKEVDAEVYGMVDDAGVLVMVILERHAAKADGRDVEF